MQALLEESEFSIRIAASQVARRYRGYLSFSDLLQEGNIWVLKHPQTVRERLDDGRRGSRRLIGQIAKHLDRLGRLEKAATLQYSTDDEVFYSAAMIELFLPAVWDESLLVNPPVTEDVGGKSGSDPSEGGNWLAGAMDVKTAWKNAPLDGNQRVALAYRYGYGLKNYEIAELLGVSDTSVSNYLRRGITLLIEELGGHPPRQCYEDCECGDGVGTRRVMSNAEARARTAENYGD